MAQKTVNVCDHGGCRTLADLKCEMCHNDLCNTHAQFVALKHPTASTEYLPGTRGLCTGCSREWRMFRIRMLLQEREADLDAMFDSVFESMRAFAVAEMELAKKAGIDDLEPGEVERRRRFPSINNDVKNVIMSRFQMEPNDAETLASDLDDQQIRRFLEKYGQRT